MKDIKLLDCTLRDGGYVNDWEFGHNNISSIFERLVDTDVEMIEVGFLDERRPFDINRTIMPDAIDTNKVFGSIEKRPEIVDAMIDFGTCTLPHIQPASETFIDCIRVIFKEHLMYDALEFCGELKKLGYLATAQLVSVTTYTDEKLKKLCDLANKVKPYAVSMVDTYGLLTPEKLIHIYSVLDKYLDPDIYIGFHAHNNFQLAYANARAFVDFVPEDPEELENFNKRGILVDATLFGMGKSAGNCPLELLAMHLNEHHEKHYKINPMLEAIDESIMDFYAKNPWGYKTYFYLCALNKCHPNYVKQFQKKVNLSVSDVNNILGEIEPEPKKLLYDAEIGERTYDDYSSQYLFDGDSYERLSKDLKGRDILLIGPGKNIQLQNDKVRNYIEEKKPAIISINYIPGEFNVDYVFVTNSHRYLTLTDSLLEIKNREVKIIATTNVSSKNKPFDFVVMREPLLEANEKIKDNSFLMLLKVLKNCGVTEISCAGFDGYSDVEDNYFNPRMEYSFIKQEALHLNQHIRQALVTDFSSMKINFITYSRYQETEDINLGAI